MRLKFKNAGLSGLARALCLVLVTLTISGCAAITKMTVRTGSGAFAASAMEMMVELMMDSKSAALAKDGMASHLLLVTALSEQHPDNLELQNKAVFLYTTYGMMLEVENPEYASKLYTLANKYGMRALSTHKKFRQGINSGEKVDNLVKLLDKRYVEALYWTASSKMLYLILHVDDKHSQLEVPESVSMVKRAMELDPTYLFGSPQLFIACYYALIPEFLVAGGGPENAAKMFEEARKVTDGKNLMVDLYEARFFAVTMGDKEKFERLLNRIIEAGPDILPGGTILNDYAKIQARHCLSIKDEIF